MFSVTTAAKGNLFLLPYHDVYCLDQFEEGALVMMGYLSVAQAMIPVKAFAYFNSRSVSHKRSLALEIGAYRGEIWRPARDKSATADANSNDGPDYEGYISLRPHRHDDATTLPDDHDDYFEGRLRLEGWEEPNADNSKRVELHTLPVLGRRAERAAAMRSTLQ